MEKFIELIRDMHVERYDTVLKKVSEQRIPVAVLSIVAANNFLDIAKKLGEQMNLTHFITLDGAQSSDDFKVISVNDALNQHLRPEYIFALNGTDARFAAKIFPSSKVIYPEHNDTDVIYDTFMNNLPALKNFYDSLIDEESKETFRGYWLGKVANRLDKIHHATTPHYMTPGFIPKHGAIVIDGGSYDGGTCLRFTERGFKVYGFELDKRLFNIAAKLAEQKDFIVENLGLGSHKHTAKYLPLNNGSTHLDDDGTEAAQIITLDEYVREKHLSRVDFIKLDVEGAELDVLKGAVATIVRFKPILALSAYHKLDDFWTLMDFVKSLDSSYEFALRQYHVSIEDEPFAVREDFQRQMVLLGLEPWHKFYGECVLLAR